jgi:DNA polymerase
MSYGIVLDHPVDFEGWRRAARRLIGAGIAPSRVIWSVGQSTDLLAEDLPLPDEPERGFSVPKSFMPLAETVIRCRDDQRFDLAYRLLWRIALGERHLLQIVSDPDVRLATLWAKSVRHDMHKMRAFLRFREVTDESGTIYVAWFEPEHFIVEANAGFFQRRFASMHWFILTPYRSLHWDGKTLAMAGGGAKSMLPDDDRFGALWNGYFTSIFNPARLKVKSMETHMARKYWKNMPETALIPAMTKAAAKRTQIMIEAHSTG